MIILQIREAESRRSKAELIQFQSIVQTQESTLDAYFSSPEGKAELLLVAKAQKAQFKARKSTDGGTSSSSSMIHQIFDLFDMDGSGEISWEEFRDVVAYLQLSVETRQLRLDFQDMDVDKSGEVDFDEFRAWWQTRQKNSALHLVLTAKFKFQQWVGDLGLYHQRAKTIIREKRVEAALNLSRESFRQVDPPKEHCVQCQLPFVLLKDVHQHECAGQIVNSLDELQHHVDSLS